MTQQDAIEHVRVVDEAARLARIDKLAKELAADLIAQNHMLEMVDDTTDPRDDCIGVFDGYDNKVYDTRVV